MELALWCLTALVGIWLACRAVATVAPWIIAWWIFREDK